tara:strand:+ start:754 stop:3315 length:2562 start_codon:yes stop_codon:yes gene_type:complete
MSSLEELSRALIAADGAAEKGVEGAAEDAAKLARAISQLQNVPESKLEKQNAEVGSFFDRNIVEPVKGAVSSVVGAVRGPSGLPELPEFQGKGAGDLTKFKTALGLTINSDEKAQIDIIKQQFPDAEIKTVSKDGKSYNIISRVNPKTNETEVEYLNAPGLSPRDAASAIGEGAIFAKAGVAKRAASIPRRIFGTGVRSGATSAGLDAASAPLGSKQGYNPGEIGLDAALGAAFEAVSPLMAGVWRAIKPLKTHWNPSTGQLTPLGARVVNEAGIDPNSMNAVMKKEFFRIKEGKDVGSPFLFGRGGNRTGYTDETAARAARAAEFNIPLTRGATTQSKGETALEDAMRAGAGARGEPERVVMSAYDAELNKSVDTAFSKFSQKVGLGQGQNIADLAGTLQEGLKRRQESAWGGINDAYDRAREFKGSFLKEAVGELRGNIRKRLKEDNVFLAKKLTPASLEAYNLISKTAMTLRKDPGIPEAFGKGSRKRDYRPKPDVKTYNDMSIQEMETTRKSLNSIRRGSMTPEDKRGVNKVIAEYDAWVDSVVDAGLFKGDPGAVDALLKARELRTQYSRNFEQQNVSDAAGKMIENIWAKAQSPEEVVNYLIGNGQLGLRPQSARAFKKIREVVGKDSEEWLALREANFKRLSVNSEGKLVSGKVFQKNLDMALEKNGSAMKELYSTAEISSFERFAKTYREAYPDATSGPQMSANFLEKLGSSIRYVMRRMGQRESFVKGNIVAGSMWNFAARLPLNIVGLNDYAAKSLAQRQTASLKVPSGQAPWFTGMGTASMSDLFTEEDRASVGKRMDMVSTLNPITPTVPSSSGKPPTSEAKAYQSDRKRMRDTLLQLGAR